MVHTFMESKILIACLLALPTFSYSPTRAPRDILVEGDEFEEVKTVKKAILELSLVRPLSGFGVTLNPAPIKNLTLHPGFYFKHSNF